MAEHNVGSADSLLRDGEMRQLELEGKTLLLTRVDGHYYATGGKCSHYGAPLEQGFLKGHEIICPWHHACFDVRSGLRLEPPGMNDLAHYATRIENGNVMVSFPNDNQTEPQAKADSADPRAFVIIGGGAAGGAAVEELLRQRFTGKIILLSAVPDVPIDRPNLSKDYLDGHAKPEWMPLRSKEWYTQRGIELRLNTRVTSVDPKSHTLTLEGGETLKYDKLLLASGANPRTLKETPGMDLAEIYTLRHLSDADKIIAAAQQGKRAVIVGASFIGMEVAAALASGRGVSVTVVGMEAIPFEQILGKEVGGMFQKAHEENGVQFHLNSEVKQFVGENGQVSAVELKSGEKLPADFVVVGVGVAPATEFLKESGLKLHEKDQSVQVSATLQASDPDIYAAGDIARYEDGEGGTRIEHWRVAQQHGMVAARNMLGQNESIHQHVPFFWTSQWKLTIRYVGHAATWDEIIYRGKPTDRNFIAFYVQGGTLKAAVGSKHDREMDAIEFILRDGMALTPAQMRDDNFDLVAYARGY